MGPKISAKKSSEKKKKLITIEIKKEIIDKHEKGTYIVDLPNNNNPPPPLHRLPRVQIIPSLMYVIKLIKPIYIDSFTFSFTVISKDSFP